MRRAGQPPFPRFVRSAILGTQHGAPEVAVGDDATDALTERRPDEAPERTLLRAAATLAAVERLGTPPLVLPPPDEPEIVDVLPRCGPRAANDLRTILAGERGDLLDEWLALAIRFGRRAPEELIPQLLARGAQATHLRAALHSAIDARGWWLAAQNPRWAYAIATEDDARTYEESDSAHARAAALRRVRETGPARALAMLEGTWATEGPADRATLLGALASGLGSADEPFLERALDDKRKEVRKAAADLLHRLPDSAATARAIAIATPLVRVERPFLRAAKLTAQLPEACTKAMLRDGIEPKPDRHGVGERAWWLEQLVEHVPPAHWRETLGISSAEMFELALASDFSDALVRGFARAIERFRDVEGLRDLLGIAAHDAAFLAAYRLADHDALSPEARTAPIRDALRHRRDGADVLLTLLRKPWNLEISRDALAYARQSLEGGADWNAFQRRSALFRTIADRLDPQTPGIRSGWPESYSSERMRDLTDDMLNAIEFRVGLYEHFADDA